MGFHKQAIARTTLLLVSFTSAAHAQTESKIVQSSIPAAPYVYRIPPTTDDGWKTASLEAVDMDRRPIEAMTEEIRRYPDWNIHAVLIERDGRLVYEEYFAGDDQRWGNNLGRVVFTRDTKHDLRSISKSITSALVGIAVGSGKIRSLDQPLLDFFPEFADATKPERARITLRHALTMSAGLQWNEEIPYTDPRNDEIGMTHSKDPIGYVLTRPSVAEPGKVWRYNGGLSQVMAAIVQRSTGEPLRNYARKVLFEPLAITDFEWIGDLAGMPAAASGVRLRPRDLAKFGSLYLHGGRWSGRQIIPAEWVRESLQRHILLPTPVSAYGTTGYGYQWWNTCFRTAAGIIETPTAVGNGQQRIYVVPDFHLVVTIMAGRYNDPTADFLPVRLLLEQIIPAVQHQNSATSASAGCLPLKTDLPASR